MPRRAGPYYKDKRETKLASSKRLYDSKREERCEQMRGYYERRKEELCEAAKGQRAKEKGCEVRELTLAQWDFILRLCERACAYCGKGEPENGEPLTQDHVIPLSQGGEHSRRNIMPACRSCNSSKCNREARQWLQAQGFDLERFDTLRWQVLTFEEVSQ